MTYAYEVHGIREDGSVFGIVCFERDGTQKYEADAEAYAVAEHYAELWSQAASVRLYGTPEVNASSVSSFNLWPDQVQLISEIPVALKTEYNKHLLQDDDVPF